MTTTPITTNRFSPTLSESMKKVTKEEGKIASALDDYGIAYRWGGVEFKREERARNGELKSYWPDFVVHRREPRFKSLILQVEGEGSASKDNDEMTEFFAKLDYLSIPIPNRLANDAAFRIILGKLLGFACGTDKPEVLSK